MDRALVVTTGTFWEYSVVTTVILLLGAKDSVLVGLWTLAARIRTLHSANLKDFYAVVKKEDSEFRLTICKEISELFISQFMGWTTLIFLMSSLEALTEVFHVPTAGYSVSWKMMTTTTTSKSALVGRSSFAVFLLCVQVARMCYWTYHHTFIKFHPVELIHHSILTLSYAAFLLPGVGTGVALVGIACDVADFHLRVSKIMDVKGVPCYSKSRIRTYGVGVVVTFVGRCFLPLALVVAALTFGGDPVQELSRSGLMLFTFFLTYLTVINVFLGLNALSSFNEARNLRRLYVEAMRDSGKALELALSMRFQLYGLDRQSLSPKKPMFLSDVNSISVTLS